MNLTGLAATTWDQFAGGDPKWDQHVFRHLIDRHPGRVLDVGCGTGRLLIPFLASGTDIVGVDASEEALAICRENARQRGLTATLYQQEMQAIDLASRYSTIIVPGGSFHLVTNREQAVEALTRFYEHLEPGGVLALSLDDPDDELREEALGRWISKGVVNRSDGTEVHQERMPERIDQSEQLKSTLIRYRVVRDDQVILEQVHTMKMRLYFRDEIQKLLGRAGFRDAAGIDGDAGSSGDQTRWKPVVVATK